MIDPYNFDELRTCGITWKLYNNDDINAYFIFTLEHDGIKYDVIEPILSQNFSRNNIIIRVLLSFLRSALIGDISQANERKSQ